VATGIGVLALGVGGVGVAAASGGVAMRASHHHAAGQVTSGSGVSSRFGDNRGILKPTPTFVARTGSLAKGTYYISVATAVFVPTTDPEGASCFLSTTGLHRPGGSDVNGEDRSGIFTVAENVVMKVKAGSKITDVCIADGPDTGEIIHVGLFAVRVADSKPGKVMKSIDVG
jgi:hypothetical protein